MTGKPFSLDEVEALACRVLLAAGASAAAAFAVARSIRLAERDGIRSHGLRKTLLHLAFRVVCVSGG